MSTMSIHLHLIAANYPNYELHGFDILDRLLSSSSSSSNLLALIDRSFLRSSDLPDPSCFGFKPHKLYFLNASVETPESPRHRRGGVEVYFQHVR